ncbi:putative disease resistance RPP13-like protein 1 [Hibiscus syriacus]|nr:putative disease resistance RPP13-like protein 1 [Hibiscus syriacus]
MNASLEDAEEKQITSLAVEHWLDELQHVAFDVEDVVDDLATEALRRKLTEHTRQPSASTNKVWKFIVPSCFRAINMNIIKFDAEIKPKIQEITARLDELVVQKRILKLEEIVKGGSEKVLQRVTTSLVDESRVYGRESDADAVVNLLMMDGGEIGEGKIGVVSILGMGGLGKTTLAQLVYKDVRIEASFELRAWVCVSEEFDVLKVTKTLIHAVASDIDESKDWNSLQVQLEEELRGRKFLIVLDDMWNENYDHWDLLCRPFAAGAAGSKILVTTRNESVAASCGGCRHHLKKLSNDDCLLILTCHALRAKNFDEYPNLKAVGERIVERCKGLPLAAKTLGGLLRTKVNQGEWEDILTSKIWDLPDKRTGIMPALRLSYLHLPSLLKRCFAYCAIFPKDNEFDKDELVLLWMAEGFLQQPRGGARMEDLGSKCFNELLSRSFFQQSSSNQTQFVMHDLINDLAKSVSRDICFNLEDMDMLEGDKLCIAVERIRYLAFTRKQYDVAKRFEVLRQTKKLRTLAALPTCMPTWGACCYLSADVLQNMLSRLRCLRVLCLSGYSIGELPNSIGHLKQLRYLNLSRSRIKQLPQSVGSLINLQTLKLHGCTELTNLPRVIENLVNLHVLDLAGTSNLQDMPFKIGKLKNLQILSKLIVGKGIGSAVSELRGLLNLRGKLSISGLENVADFRDASNGNLKDKDGLTELDLQWSDESLNSENEEGQMHVLESLMPGKNMEKLRILFYGGKMFPSWLGDPSLTNIVWLELLNCRNSILLPSLGRLPSLKILSIVGMDRVQKVDLTFYGHGFTCVNPFPSLEILRFKDMLEWTCWSSPSRANEDSGEEFPCLRELTVENCPKLIGKLPGRLLSLVKLVIKHCPKLESSSMSLPSLNELNVEDSNEELLGSILGPSSLTAVTTKGLPVLQHLQNGVVRSSGALRVLSISSCIGLTSLQAAGDILLNITAVEHLKIKNCSRFSETGFFPMLKHLTLKDCQSLKFLPSAITMLSCPLEELEIEDCPALTFFANGRLPTVLRRLKIRFCEALVSLPQGLMQIDNSTSNVSHLENLEIVGCPSLISFPEGKFPSSLKILKIWRCFRLEPLSDTMLPKNGSLELISVFNCSTMTCLPGCINCLTHLTELNLHKCTALKYFPETGLQFPNLRKLDIYECSSLKSLPDQMLSLTSLNYLTIGECPGLVSFPKAGWPPNLLALKIWNCENLKQPLSEWNLHDLASLSDLTIAGAPDIVSFPDEMCLLPTSLMSMYISRLHNLRSLSVRLCDLTLLKELEISECPKLQCLPKEGLPADLGRFCIRDCQLLKLHCLEGKGAYWPMISHIPCLEIESTDD